MKKDCRHVQKECRTCGETGHLEAVCKLRKVEADTPKTKEDRGAGAAAKPMGNALCVSPVWNCVECWTWQHHEGPRCRAKACKGTRRRLEDLDVIAPAAAEAGRKDRFHTTKKGKEVVGRVLQLAGSEEEGVQNASCPTSRPTTGLPT